MTDTSSSSLHVTETTRRILPMKGRMFVQEYIDMITTKIRPRGYWLRSMTECDFVWEATMTLLIAAAVCFRWVPCFHKYFLGGGSFWFSRQQMMLNSSQAMNMEDDTFLQSCWNIYIDHVVVVFEQNKSQNRCQKTKFVSVY